MNYPALRVKIILISDTLPETSATHDAYTETHIKNSVILDFPIYCKLCNNRRMLYNKNSLSSAFDLPIESAYSKMSNFYERHVPIPRVRDWVMGIVCLISDISVIYSER